jgi:hypothetical protein
MRFTCVTSQANFGIYYKDLLDAIFVATAAAVGYALFDQVKINFVEVWCSPAVGGAPSTVAVQFAGAIVGAVGDGRIWSDTSMAIEPAHVKARPERLSQAAQWQVGDARADAAFFLTAPATSVIDVDLSYRTIQPLAPIATTNVPVAAVAGEVYFRGLDGLASAATNFPAVAPLTN